MSSKRRDASKETIEHLKNLSEDLDKLLESQEVPSVQELEKKSLPSIRHVKPLDYELIKEEVDEKAEQIIQSIVTLYLPQTFIFEHEYVNQKMSIDKLTISSLVFQMKTAEHAIKKLLEELDSGNTNFKLFEVLSSLQKSKMEIVKHIAQFMILMENNYKNLKFDYEANLADNQKSIGDGNQNLVVKEESNKFRGTKNVMMIMQQVIEQNAADKFEKIEEDE